MDKLCNAINKIYTYTALALLAVLTAAMAIQVFTRYVLGASLSGTEELGRYCFIWMTMLGASICIAGDSHATVTILNDQLKGKVKLFHGFTINLLILGCATLLLVQGVKMTLMTTKQLTPTLHIPMAIIYSSLPVGAMGMIFNLINKISKQVRTMWGRGEA